QRRPTRLIQHEPPSRGDSTPLKRIAGYRAPLTPRLARPRRNLQPPSSMQRTDSPNVGRDKRPDRQIRMAEGAGFEPAAQGLPVHGISSAAPSAARSPLLGNNGGGERICTPEGPSGPLSDFESDAFNRARPPLRVVVMSTYTALLL